MLSCLIQNASNKRFPLPTRDDDDDGWADLTDCSFLQRRSIVLLHEVDRKDLQRMPFV